MYNKIYRIVCGYGITKTFKILLAIVMQVVSGIALVYFVGLLMKMLLGSSLSEQSAFGIQFNIENLLIILIVTQVLASLCGIITEFFKARYIAYLSAWLRSKLLSQTMNREYQFFTSQDSSHIQQTIYQYSGFFSHLTNSMLDFVIKGIMVIVFVSAAIWQSPLLCLSLFSLIIIFYGFLIYITKKIRKKIIKKLNESDQTMQSVSLQMLSGIKLLRISQKTEQYFNHYRKSVLEFSKYDSLRPFIALAPRYLIEGLMICSISIYLLVVHYNGMIENELAATGVLVFVAFKVFPLMQACYSQFSNISTQGHIIERVYKEYADKIEIEKARQGVKFDEVIEVKNLLFKYVEDENELTFPNFSIKKGQTIGIQGLSGSGKSTLLDILLGMYDATGGGVYVDGEKVNSAYLRGLHDITGYVGQDVFLLHSSIAENIALEDPGNIDMKKVVKCAKKAQVDCFVENLANKYDTVVGDRGVRLSGGQRQRIAIARALYSEPEILFFDEATSALDNETESRIMDTVYDLEDNLTIILVAHRIDTLNRADKIIDLNIG